MNILYINYSWRDYLVLQEVNVEGGDGLLVRLVLLPLPPAVPAHVGSQGWTVNSSGREIDELLSKMEPESALKHLNIQKMLKYYYKKMFLQKRHISGKNFTKYYHIFYYMHFFVW